MDDADGTFGPVDPGVVGAELPLGQEVADRAVDLQRTGKDRRHPILYFVTPREARSTIVAVHHWAAQDRDPMQGEQHCQGDWSTSRVFHGDVA